MSAVRTALREFSKLEFEDFQLMQIIENQIKDYEYVPHEAIQKQANFSSSEIEFRFPILIKKGLVRGYKEKYAGYQLTTAGHDILAIKNLVKNDIIIGFGRQLGVGKESDIYEAFALDKKQHLFYNSRPGINLLIPASLPVLLNRFLLPILVH